MLYVHTMTHALPLGWHVGERFSVPPEIVTKIQADGDELEYILDRNPGLSAAGQRVVTVGILQAQQIARCIREDYGPERTTV